jgi:pimeloyl-ACP methyl ester carboxylesterase
MIKSYNFSASDGVNLVWHETGEGRPVVLIHGYFSDAMMLTLNFDVAPKGRFRTDNNPPYGFYFLRFLRVLNKGKRS